MEQDIWATVDRYFGELFIPDDPVLNAALESSDAAGLPPISVSPAQGKLLQLLARIAGARTILEIGTLGAYSTIWLGRALPPGGRLITLEADPRHAEVARTNIARAGLNDVVDLRLGRAIDTLPLLTAEAPFDFVFIDADKESTAEYYQWAVRLARPGTVIVVDNVVRGGAVVSVPGDPRAAGIRRFAEMAGADERVSATVVQNVGSKGYDGFALLVVNASS